MTESLMHAAVVDDFTGPRDLRVREVRVPVAAPGEVLIDVHVAGVSYPDLLHTRGLHQDRPDLPFIPGWEVAGVVHADAAGFRAGERVAAVTLLGGFAERVAAPAATVFRLPDTLDLEAAAALPLNYLTAVFGLRHRGGLVPGETVLVHGASGGVGSATCQVAAALGCRVIAVASTPEKAEAARRAGATDAVSPEGFKDAVMRLTTGRGVDLVVDPVGGERFTDSLRCLAPDGRLLVVGFTGGEIPTVKVNRLLLTNTGVLGVNISSVLRRTPEIAQRLWADLVPLIDAGHIAPLIAHVRPLDEAVDALLALEERRVIGKELLRIR